MSDVPIFYNLQTAGDVTAITGKLADLETTVKTNLVAAINELDGNFPVSVANGGTGQTSLTSGNILLGNGTSAIDSVDVLPITKGGTGQTSLTSGNILIGNGTSGIDSVDVLPIAKGGTGGSTATLARTSLDVLTATELYYNASGSSGTIVLSDSIANYQKIDICAVADDTHSFATNVWTDGASSFTFNLIIGNAYTASGTNPNRMSICGSLVTISGTSLTWGVQTFATLRPATESSQITVGNWTGTKIYKIVGYKY